MAETPSPKKKKTTKPPVTLPVQRGTPTSPTENKVIKGLPNQGGNPKRSPTRSPRRAFKPNKGNTK
jgi:hypothetical protein